MKKGGTHQKIKDFILEAKIGPGSLLNRTNRLFLVIQIEFNGHVTKIFGYNIHNNENIMLVFYTEHDLKLLEEWVEAAK